MMTTVQFLIDVMKKVVESAYSPSSLLEYKEKEINRLITIFENRSVENGSSISTSEEEEFTERSIRESREIDDVDRAIDYLRKAGEHLACPICRGAILANIGYLLTYDAKTRLLEEGIPYEQVDEVYEKRLKNEVERRLNELRRELRVDSYSEKEGKMRFIKNFY